MSSSRPSWLIMALYNPPSTGTLPMIRSSQRILMMGMKNGSSSLSSLLHNNNNHIINHLGLIPSLRCLSSQPPNNNNTPGPPPPRSPKSNRLTASLGLIGSSAILLAGKGKYILGALKLTKFASLGSMIFTIGTYSMFFGVPYAIGMVGLILIHETGHALVMHKLGVPFSPMVFVPFMGAAVAMKDHPKDAYDEALIAFGGPYLGTAGAMAVSIAANTTESQLLYALADFGYMINLFNLLPIGSMDGGRICNAVSPYAGVVGLGMGGGLIYYNAITNPIFYLVMLAGGYTTFQRFYDPIGHAPRNYYKITNGQKALVTGGYFGLVAFLLGAMSMNGRKKKSPEVLIKERERELTFVEM